MVRALWPVNASPDWKVPTVPEPLKRQSSLNYTRLCRNAQASADQGFSTASQGSCHVHGTPCWNPSTFPYPTFFASAKPIFKMDCSNWQHATKVKGWSKQVCACVFAEGRALMYPSLDPWIHLGLFSSWPRDGVDGLFIHLHGNNNMHDL